MITTTSVPRGRGRPKGSRNARKRGPLVRRPVPPLTPDEIYEFKEVHHFVPHGGSSVDRLIRENRFPRPRFAGNKRIFTGAQLIAYRACLARGEEWVEPEQQPMQSTGDSK